MTAPARSVPASTRELRVREPVAVVLLMALTFSTGVADAVGYLGLDKVFTGNMTGNVVILGMGAAGAEDLPAVGPACALAAFMAGAVVGGRLVRGAAAGWSTRVSALMAAVAVLLGGCALTAASVAGVGEDPAATVAVAALVAVAMGLQAAVARHVAVKDLTTVVVTSTITGLAADSRLGAGVPQPWARRGVAVGLLAAGAAVGALLLRLHLAWGLGVSAGITAGVALAGHLWARRAAHGR
ncbi:uncharacterized membrane protein YoaK (UPF0700 family) [Nocardioides zeae]|uniref:Uncharacterized membrane protein YoaK (UPF0700 family) n=1 Tax=Nocardioides zeae TaxID=1457234 RepID=A0ACC6IE02_9ACTN|nr:YoaK family protein [Nocardioides zeae]MDR6174077.1 uncharacterized membrane protein YoaK (UPF0700 family) [Nocardioides zeae]MDR6208884.1 uncharacterized membrane protein YoaK (UPF0700 family) [Nocardioides zeae]